MIEELFDSVEPGRAPEPEPPWGSLRFGCALCEAPATRTITFTTESTPAHRWVPLCGEHEEPVLEALWDDLGADWSMGYMTRRTWWQWLDHHLATPARRLIHGYDRRTA